jgi:DNA-binding beta-propeller fold protein YncE
VAVGLGAVWATNTDDGTVTRIDPRSGRVVETIPVAFCPIGIVVGAGAVWVAHCSNAGRPGRVTKIDPRSNRPVAEVAVGKDPNGIAVSGGLVWVANQGGDTITRIDPRTVKVVDTLAVPTGRRRLAPHPTDIAAGAGGVWISNNGDGTVARIELSKLRP